MGDPDREGLVQRSGLEQVQLSIQGRDPAFKHHPTFACDGEPVAIPRGLRGVGGQGAVGAVVVDEVFEGGEWVH